MERIHRHRSQSTGIILTMLLIVSCGVKQPDNETVYEEIIASGYCLLNGNPKYERNRDRFLTTLLAHNNSDYKNMYCMFSARFYEKYISYPDYLDKIYREEPYLSKYGIELKKDTLGAFYCGMTKIELNAEPGRKFCDYPPEEQLETDWGITLKSKIYDTVFNDILHVKQCFRYTYEDDSWRVSNRTNSMIGWSVYYDVYRCIFVHAEAWDLGSNKPVYIHRVERVNKIDSMYFNKIWNMKTSQDTILEPVICIGSYSCL